MGSLNQDALSATISEIADAFARVQREDGVTLHEAEVIDDYGSAQERSAARQRDMDSHWHDVPGADIEQHYSILSFLDAKGLRYYLPAYMIWTLRNYATSPSATIDSTIYALGFDNSHFHIFTPRQSKAIARFLEYMVLYATAFCDSGAASSALDTYWDRFL